MLIQKACVLSEQLELNPERSFGKGEWTQHSLKAIRMPSPCSGLQRAAVTSEWISLRISGQTSLVDVSLRCMIGNAQDLHVCHDLYVRNKYCNWIIIQSCVLKNKPLNCKVLLHGFTKLGSWCACNSKKAKATWSNGERKVIQLDPTTQISVQQLNFTKANNHETDPYCPKHVLTS